MKTHLTLKFLFATFLVAASLASTLATAQSSTPTAAKRELATRVVALQQGPEMDRLLQQLANSAVQPMLATWGSKLETNVPQAGQAAAAERLNAELQRFGQDALKLIKGKVATVSDETLVEAYMERFSEDELRQLNSFFTSPVIKKYQSLAPELGNIMVQKIIEVTRSDMQDRARAFDEAALRIVGPDRGASAAPATAPSPGSTAAEKPGTKAKK